MARRSDLTIPYGVANFKWIRTEGYYYVDKTEYLAKMEELRPFDPQTETENTQGDMK